MRRISCPLCACASYRLLLKTTDRLHHVDDHVFDLVKCNACGLVYTQPQPSWEELKRYYPDEYVSYQETKRGAGARSWKQRVITVLSRWKRRVIKPSIPRYLRESKGRFLDVGCSNGHYLESVRTIRPEWEFYGVEPGASAARGARKKGFKVKTEPLERCDFPDDWFDVVYLSHVLEHVPDPLATLRDIHRILKPGGTLVFTVPNFRSFGARAFKQYWFPLDLPRHLVHFTPRTVKAFLKKAGFGAPRIRFNKAPKHLIKSYRDWRGRGHENLGPEHYHPLAWWLLRPFSMVLGYLGFGDIMKVELRKDPLK